LRGIVLKFREIFVRLKVSYDVGIVDIGFDIEINNFSIEH